MKKVNISYHLKDYFTFSKTERNGIVFLLILLFLIICCSYFIPQIYAVKSQGDFAHFKKQIDLLYSLDTIKQNVHGNYSPRDAHSLKPIIQEVNVVELNSSDSVELTSLPGIGPVLASRIIKYRRLLGGFYSVNQLKEVYGLSADNFEKAKPFLKTDQAFLKRFLVDTAGFRTLFHHPYIGKDRTYKILKIKRGLKDGAFSISDLKNNEVFDSIQWEKVYPYFLFVKKQ